MRSGPGKRLSIPISPVARETATPIVRDPTRTSAPAIALDTSPSTEEPSASAAGLE